MAVEFRQLASTPCRNSENVGSNRFCGDSGLDYNEGKGYLVSSLRFDSGDTPHTLNEINRMTGDRRAVSGFNPPNGNLKLTTVRRVRGGCQQQWPPGTMFTGNQNPGEIVKIENGVAANPWVTLPGGDSPIDGGLFHDRWCAVDGDLVVVSKGNSRDSDTGGRIWRVNAAGNATLLGTIFRPGGNARAQLEGVITLPNDLAQYGPWAGKIITGDADKISCPSSDEPRCQPGDDGYRNGTNAKIYAITPNTALSDSMPSVTPLSPANPLTHAVCSQNDGPMNSPSCLTPFTIVGRVPHPKDFDFIEGDFFGVGSMSTKTRLEVILKAPAERLPLQPVTRIYPDILVTQEYPIDQPHILKGVTVPIGANSGLYTLMWNGTSFVSTELSRTGGPEYSRWEQVTFVPLSDIRIVHNPKNAPFNVGEQLTSILTLSGASLGTATQIVLESQLPTIGGLTWALDPVRSSALEVSESCVLSEKQALKCNFRKLLLGEQINIALRTTSAGGATAAVCAAGRFVSTATVRADGMATKQDAASYSCTPGSYTLSNSPKNASYKVGDNIAFTLTVRSTGPDTASNLTLNNPLPTLGNLNNWTITANPGNVCRINYNTLTCPFGNLGSGEVRIVTVATDAAGGADASACPGDRKLNSTATLTGTGSPKIDTGDFNCTPPPLERKARPQGFWGNKTGLAVLSALQATGVSSVSVGTRSRIVFSGANLPSLINRFMPQRNAPKELPQSYVNPTRGNGVGEVNNFFAGQVLTLQLNVLTSEKNISPFVPGLKDTVLPPNLAGVLLPFNYTIGQALADANKALGGDGLPSYAANVEMLSRVIDAINNL